MDRARAAHSQKGVALKWAPKGKRKRGRPKERTVERSVWQWLSPSWVEVGLAAANRVS